MVSFTSDDEGHETKPQLQRFTSQIHGEQIPFEFGDPYHYSEENRDGLITGYIHAFDESAALVRSLIESDIWPRFMKSNCFREGIQHAKLQQATSVDV